MVISSEDGVQLPPTLSEFDVVEEPPPLDVEPPVPRITGAPQLLPPRVIVEDVTTGEPSGWVVVSVAQLLPPSVIVEGVTTGEPPGSVIALGGGCLVNRLIGERLAAELEARGHEVLLPVDLPPGDGGLAYGQAVVAAVASARGVKPSPDSTSRPSTIAMSCPGTPRPPTSVAAAKSTSTAVNRTTKGRTRSTLVV